MDNDNKALMLYFDNRDLFEFLNDSEFRALVMALFDYGETGRLPDKGLDRTVMMLFTQMKKRVDWDRERYDEMCRKRSEAGKKGGRPKKSNGRAGSAEGRQTKANTSEEKQPKAHTSDEKQTKAKQANGFSAKQTKANESKKSTNTVTNTITNTNTITDTYTITDINPLTPLKRGNTRAGARFSPPSLDEVRAYCDEINARINPERFIDYYSAKGWVVGKSPMRDWRAALRNWERDRKEKAADDPGSVEKDYSFGTWTVEALMNGEELDRKGF